MISTRVLIGITLVIFFVGLSTGFVIFQTSNQSATTIQSHDPTVESNLARFDKLDFEAFSKQNWELFNQIHSSDVLVVFPNGRETRGIDQHTKDIFAMFVYAPDTRVTSHPIKFGSGQWTVSTGILEGTFTQPIPFPDGGTISPT